ncbi:MAG: peptidoglycan-associated lipoprotein Pal [Pseudomonadota bacterium]
MAPAIKMIIGAAALAALAACTNTADTANSTGAGTEGTVTPVTQVDESSAAYFTASVGDKVFFDTNSSTLDAAAQTTLTFQADWLLRFPDRTIVIEGHADERGTREYNLALGARRAQAAYDFLLAQGVPAGRMSTVTFGKERPVSLCSDESCWSQNRRSISVLAGGAPLG